jgi:hypothetical protein
LRVRGHVEYSAGRFGQALSLKRDGSVLFIYRAPTLMPRDRSWTIECWIKPTGKPTARMAILGIFGNMGRRIPSGQKTQPTFKPSKLLHFQCLARHEFRPKSP